MPTLTVVAIGKPSPKGSLKHVGNGRLVESLKASKPWRETVVIAASSARDRAGWVTLLGAVSVTGYVILPRPKTVTREYPITRSSGDIDKHDRNILDALTDAQIMRDDSQVIELNVLKYYPRDANQEPGAYLWIKAFTGVGK